MDDLQTREAPLEYWFFKFTSDRLALLVDFIARRRRRQAEVRLSFWVDDKGRVERARAPTWRTEGPMAAIAGCELHPQGSSGAVADVEWDLAYEPGPTRVDPAPRPLKLLRPLDMQLLSRPQARFGGSVRVGDERFAVADAAGMLCHYWGARLPERWRWISVNHFGDGRGAVEAMLVRSRLWGLPRSGLDAGYVFLTRGDQTRLLISPFTGLMRIDGSWHDFQLVARPFAGGETVRLACGAPPERYNDLGEGIRQTLLGSCSVNGVTAASDSAGLEVRGD